MDCMDINENLQIGRADDKIMVAVRNRREPDETYEIAWLTLDEAVKLKRAIQMELNSFYGKEPE